MGGDECLRDAGKSNLMDAVSFVMGVKTTDLRGAKVSDFRSHSAQKGDPNTSVTLYYHNDARRWVICSSLQHCPPCSAFCMLQGATVSRQRDAFELVAIREDSPAFSLFRGTTLPLICRCW